MEQSPRIPAEVVAILNGWETRVIAVEIQRNGNAWMQLMPYDSSPNRHDYIVGRLDDDGTLHDGCVRRGRYDIALIGTVQNFLSQIPPEKLDDYARLRYEAIGHRAVFNFGLAA